MSTTKHNNFEMFGTPQCLLNINPPSINSPPNLCLFSKNFNPHPYYTPTNWCQGVSRSNRRKRIPRGLLNKRRSQPTQNISKTYGSKCWYSVFSLVSDLVSIRGIITGPNSITLPSNDVWPTFAKTSNIITVVVVCTSDVTVTWLTSFT